MSDSHVTSDLRRWVAEQSDLGHPPDALLGSMLASGWSASAAERALSEVLLGRVAGRTDTTQLTLYKSLGHVVQDLAATACVHRRATGDPA